jgi:hypothetical protein
VENALEKSQIPAMFSDISKDLTKIGVRFVGKSPSLSVRKLLSMAELGRYC